MQSILQLGFDYTSQALSHTVWAEEEPENEGTATPFLSVL